MKIHILLFYKFVKIDNPNKFRDKHLQFCNDLGIKGKIILAKEGINGSISGTKAQVMKYKIELKKDKRFSDIVFKEEIGLIHPFNKMIVKIKEEIIRLDKKLDMDKVGKHISPKEFLDLYKNKKEYIILDTRNDYESKIGKFKGAITPKIKTFREFPKFVNNFKKNKDKKIVMYCTGGIRCEKASAYMIKQGFKNVSQLNGGIITFCQEFPNTVWEGSCFVFDNRITSSIGQKEKAFTKCINCKEPCDLYKNCKNKECNKLIIICPNCEKQKHSCCSQKCMRKVLSN